jgi:hypothetical protein
LNLIYQINHIQEELTFHTLRSGHGSLACVLLL